MKRNRLYLSTIDENAQILCRKYGLGMEIAEYSTAWNMDEHFPETDQVVQKKILGIPHRILHAPYSELFPCAIDPKARQLARERYRQAIQLAKGCHAEKVVIHGGYHPRLYYPEWYVEQSIAFWKAFLEEDPGVEIVLENVLEEEPEWMLDILKGVDDSRLGLCLDVGHVNAYSKRSPLDWLETCSSRIRHFHIHNNDGTWDTHSPLPQGSIPIKQFLDRAGLLCPDATFTLELMEAESSVHWLLEE